MERKYVSLTSTLKRVMMMTDHEPTQYLIMRRNDYHEHRDFSVAPVLINIVMKVLFVDNLITGSSQGKISFL